ncbi:MAG: hypothetical protein JNL43_05735 [Flavobacteriales bacterium]|nr:hypothetical protein [Flavobacteriales bacterium]
MQQVLEILTVIATAMVKFMFTGLVSYGIGNTFWETLVYTAIGGCLGTVLFYLAGSRVLEWFRQRHVRRVLDRLSRGLPPKPIFTRTNRTIVRVKQRYGMRGLAGLALPILSIPITSVLAAKYFRHDRRTLPTLISSVLVWSVVLSVAWSFIR